MELCISKAPRVLRTILYNYYSKTSTDWQSFMKIGENNMWLIQPDETRIALANIAEKTTYEKRNDKTCLLFEKCSHSTDFWIILKKLKNRGYCIMKTSDKDELTEFRRENSNKLNNEHVKNNTYKNHYINDVLSIKTENPFIKTVQINGKEHKGLIDTGADISLIPQHFFHQKHRYIN
ncbi:hypothetical protein BDAP_000602 [Binucleata daphniae]